MNDINTEIISNIILKSREINIQEDLSIPEDQEDLSDTEWRQRMSEYQNDLTYIELKDLINELEPDQQRGIIALMYVGRGDFSKEEWQAALAQANTIASHRRADYLISKNMLADYLEEGLSTLGYASEL